METQRKLFKAEVYGQWVPVWATDLDHALALVELEYGEKNVGRVKQEVTHG